MALRPRKKIKDGVVVSDTNVAPYSPQSPIERPTQDVEDLRYLMDTAVSPDDWTAIFRKAKDMSFEGNIKAMEFLAKYRWGIPATMTLEQGERRENITIVEVVKTTREKTEPETYEVKSLPNTNIPPADLIPASVPELIQETNAPF